MTLGAGGAWIGGVILIGLGILFLLQNFGVPIPGNWWAVFLLLPGVGALWTAWRMYWREGRMTASVIGTAAGGRRAGGPRRLVPLPASTGACCGRSS